MGARRIHTLDETVFNKLTPESAYWIGFLLADGCILADKRRSRCPSRLSVCLASIDSGHIQKLRQFLNSSHTIYINKNNRNAVHLQITSKKLCAQLGYWGVTPRKSFTAKANSRLVLNWHFWRGVLDGDGCFTLRKPYGIIVKLVGSLPLLQQFKYALHKISPKCPASIRQAVGMYEVVICGLHAKKLCQLLLSKATVFLDRKYTTIKKMADYEQHYYRFQPGNTWGRLSRKNM